MRIALAYHASRRLLLPALAALLLGSCQDPEPDPDPIPVVSPKKLSGRIFLPDGEPAAGARIRVYSVTHSPFPHDSEPALVAPPVYLGAADSMGRYHPDSLEGGLYNIFGELGEWMGWQDSVLFPDPDTSLPAVFLQPPGAYSGRIEAHPYGLFPQVRLGLPGSPFVVSADDQGRFRFGPMPPGHFVGHMKPATQDYQVRHFDIDIRPGRQDTATAALVLPYVGIPVVAGLRARLDTLNGIVRLSWSSVSSSVLQEYLVFRDTLGPVSRPGLLVGSTRDTSFADTLYSVILRPGRLSRSDTGMVRWNYRVLVQTHSGEVVSRNIPVTLETHSPASAIPIIGIEAMNTRRGLDADTAGPDYEVEYRMSFGSRVRTMKSLSWQIDSGDPAPAKTLNARSGIGFFKVTTPTGSARMRIRVRLVDEFGTEWSDSTFLVTQPDRPRPISRFRSPMPMARLGFATVVHKDRIYVLGGYDPRDNLPLDRVEQFDHQTDTWTLKAPMPTKRSGLQCGVFGGKIVAMGGRRGPGGVPVGSIELYDPDRDSWSVQYREWWDTTMIGAVEIGGRLLSAGFSDQAGRWVMNRISLASNDVIRTSINMNPNTLVFAGRREDQLYYISRMPGVRGVDGLPEAWNYVGRFSARENNGAGRMTWNDIGWRDRGAQAVALVDFRFYLIGGFQPDRTRAGWQSERLEDGKSPFSNRVDCFDANNGSWVPVPPPSALLDRARMGTAVIGNRIFILGGIDKAGVSTSVEEYVAPY